MAVTSRTPVALIEQEEAGELHVEREDPIVAPRAVRRSRRGGPGREGEDAEGGDDGGGESSAHDDS
jgi:hypothetical protein